MLRNAGPTNDFENTNQLSNTYNIDTFFPQLNRILTVMYTKHFNQCNRTTYVDKILTLLGFYAL